MTLFRGFNETFVRLLDIFFAEKSYPAGHVIVREGTLQNHFFILIAGEVGVSRHLDGKDVTLDTLPAGDFFGEINLFDPGLATATVTALTPVVTLEISNGQFREFIREKPELAADFTFQLAEKIVKRFRQSSQTLADELTRPEALEKGREWDLGRMKA